MVGKELARQYVPGAGILEQLLGLSPFHSTAPAAANVLTNLLGGYLTPRKTPKQERRRELELTGLSPLMVEVELHREGY
jgi:hypothetical protein